MHSSGGLNEEYLILFIYEDEMEYERKCVQAQSASICDANRNSCLVYKEAAVHHVSVCSIEEHTSDEALLSRGGAHSSDQDAVLLLKWLSLQE